MKCFMYFISTRFQLQNNNKTILFYPLNTEAAHVLRYMRKKITERNQKVTSILKQKNLKKTGFHSLPHHQGDKTHLKCWVYHTSFFQEGKGTKSNCSTIKYQAPRDQGPWRLRSRARILMQIYLKLTWLQPEGGSGDFPVALMFF